MNKAGKFPPCWDEARVKQVLDYYNSQSGKEAVAEDEAAFLDPETVMNVPQELLPAVRKLIARHKNSS